MKNCCFFYKSELISAFWHQSWFVCPVRHQQLLLPSSSFSCSYPLLIHYIVLSRAPCEKLRHESLDVRCFACSGLVPTGMPTPLRPDDRGKSGSASSLRRHRSALTAPQQTPRSPRPAPTLLYINAPKITF